MWCCQTIEPSGDQVRRDANQPAPTAPELTPVPRISRYPSAFTPVAIKQCALFTRPFSRTLSTGSAYAARNAVDACSPLSTEAVAGHLAKYARRKSTEDIGYTEGLQLKNREIDS
jgi:hypothetical protein